MMRKAAKIMAVLLCVLLVALLGAWTAVGYASTKGIETPKYTLVSKTGDYEIREYAGYIRAEVVVKGTFTSSLNSGFRKVADYIFGNNTAASGIAMTAPVISEKAAASEKIAMTAPVISEKSGEEGSYVVAFVMPSEYTLEKLPKPNNSEVTLREVPKQRYAVLVFGGYATEARTADKTAELVAALGRDGIKTAGEPMLAQYDPPWTPPYMRTNEVHVALAGDPAPAG